MTEQTASQDLGKVVGVIPARLESVRMPRKPLRLIAGHPMIAWVYHRARQAQSFTKLLVATDSEEIAEYCHEDGIPVAMTSREHRSGTDRLVEVMRSEPADIYVNIQGDEPMVNGEHIEQLLWPFRKVPATQISTLKVGISAEDARDPNNTKVVADGFGNALYFSRAQIPHDRDKSGGVRYFKHLGLYAYRAAALAKFSELPPSSLEQAERLEQLRFLENGFSIAVVETPDDTVGVDTEANVRQVEEFFARNCVVFPKQ